MTTLENKYRVPKHIWSRWTPNQQTTYNQVRDFLMLSKGNFPMMKHAPQHEWELMAKVIAEGVTTIVN